MTTPLDTLWGATMVGITWSPDLAALTMELQIEDWFKSRVHRHQVDFTDIQTLKFSRSTPLPWDYTELTSISARNVPTGIEVFMELWSSNNTLTIVCGEISVDKKAIPRNSIV
jgi:hypothetical protein